MFQSITISQRSSENNRRAALSAPRGWLIVLSPIWSCFFQTGYKTQGGLLPRSSSFCPAGCSNDQEAMLSSASIVIYRIQRGVPRSLIGSCYDAGWAAVELPCAALLFDPSIISLSSIGQIYRISSEQVKKALPFFDCFSAAYFARTIHSLGPLDLAHLPPFQFGRFGKLEHPVRD